MVMRGSVAGIFSLVSTSAPKQIQGSVHTIMTSHVHHLRKLLRNLFPCVRSSCLPNIMPTSPRASPPPIMSTTMTGRLNITAPIPIHDPSTHQSHTLAHRTIKNIRPRNIIGVLEFFYGTITDKKFS